MSNSQLYPEQDCLIYSAKTINHYLHFTALKTAITQTVFLEKYLNGNIVDDISLFEINILLRVPLK